MRKKITWMRASICLLTLSAFLSACADDPDPIQNSFAVADNSDHTQISISKNALDKEFMLHANLVMQMLLPQFSGLKSRVVTFKKRGDQLAMLQTPEGSSINKDLPQNIILAVFPILKEEKDRIIFDFNKGMSSIFALGDWHASDFEGSQWSSDLLAVPTAQSYIESANFTAENELAIRQIATVDGGKEGMIPVEVKYYLSPYAKNPNFVPTKSKGFDRMGFFEVSPQITMAGEQVVYATKWDQNKKITYSISANTPEEYREAIRDGVLYWNKAFGKEVFAVDVAPEGMTAPDMNHNIIQWVNWDNAGFAYADAQMDPRTGETLHAQIFLTSAFAVSGLMKAGLLVSKMAPDLAKGKFTANNYRESLNSKPLSHSRKMVTLRGFAAEPLCNLDATNALVSGVQKLVANGADETAILKASQDYIREVVAHEVGHTLGMRHNFAGSLGQNFPMSKKDEILARYLQEGHTPAGAATTSSVMDYLNFEESALSGDAIANAPSVFAYDQKAVAYLYNGEKFKNNDIPLFCTDSHLQMSMPDCIYFDAGTNPFEKATYDFGDHLNLVPVLLKQIYESVKTMPQGDRERPWSVDDVDVTGDDAAYYVIDTRMSAVKAMLKNLRYLQIDRRNDDIFSRIMQQYSYVPTMLKAAGGFDGMFPSVKVNYAEEGFKRFAVLMQKDAQLFSEEEMKKILAKGQKFFFELQNAVAWTDIDLAQYLTENVDKLQVDFKPMVVSRMNEYLFAAKGEPISFPNTQITRKSGLVKTFTTDVKIQKFGFDGNYRAQMLMTGAKSLTTAQLNEMETKFKKMVSDSFGGEDVTTFDLPKITPEIAAWVEEQIKVLKAFDLAAKK